MRLFGARLRGRLRFLPATVVFVLAFSANVFGQEAKAGSSIRFSLNFPGSSPESYVIEIESGGRATYDSMARLTPEADAATAFHWDFAVATSTCDRLFLLAKEAGYFTGQIESGRKLAFTGEKTLSFRDKDRTTSAKYNYSDDKRVQQLTLYFQSVALTLEFVRRLDYDLRFQKLALDAELKTMEQMLTDQQLEEVQAAQPLLRKIAADSTVIKTVRARAQRLADSFAGPN